MKDLNTYIRDKQVNEGLFDFIKRLWAWLTGKTNLSYQEGNGTALGSGSTESYTDSNGKSSRRLKKGIKLQTQHLVFEQIDLETFRKIINISAPDEGSDNGFWYFDKIKGRPEYNKFNADPWYTQCICITDKTMSANSDDKNIYGLITFSLNSKLQPGHESIMMLDYDIVPQCINANDIIKKALTWLSEYGKQHNVKNIEVAINNNDIGTTDTENDLYKQLGFERLSENGFDFWRKSI